MTEIWKPIVGFEGYYEVSSLGQVRRLDTVVFVSSPRGDHYRNIKGGEF